VADPKTNSANDGVEDMVREALRVWRHNDSLDTAASSNSHRHLNQSRTRLDVLTHMADGACLSLTFHRVPIQTFCSQLGNRLLFWPDGMGEEQQQRISVVSSRLSERKDLHRRWFDALRTAVVRCDPQQACLCVVEGTAACDAVSRAAALFGVPLLKINVGDGQITRPEDLIAWCRTAMSQPRQVDVQIGVQNLTLCISPEFVTSEQVNGVSGASAADVASILAGDRVIALSCREGGTIPRLLLDHLQQEPKPTVLLVDDDQAAHGSTHKALIEAGAVQWLLQGQQQAYVATKTVAGGDRQADQSKHASSSVLSHPEDWLCHWTRPRRGPWPDETVDDYWDALIMGCPSADHSALSALLRIMETRQLLPSTMSHGAVSWTAVPLVEFPQRRVYRRHLRRYDFEPWGIAVRRSVLAARGCCPVAYVQPGEEVTEEPWQTQFATDAAGKVDWTHEREWRILGRVDLSEISAEDIVMFVDTEAEATVLCQSSQWSVICVPGD